MFLQYNSHHRNAAALPIPNIFLCPEKETVHSLFRKDKRLFFPSYPPVCVVGRELSSSTLPSQLVRLSGGPFKSCGIYTHL